MYTCIYIYIIYIGTTYLIYMYINTLDDGLNQMFSIFLCILIYT